jgi:hypothetical protein
MADFAQWAVAAAPDRRDAFLEAYEDNRAGGNHTAIEASDVGRHLLHFIADKEWTGTATELLDALNEHVGEHVRRAPTWPKNARTLRGALTRVAPSLRAAGVAVDFSRNKRERLITLKSIISAPRPEPSSPSPASPLVGMRDTFDDAEQEWCGHSVTTTVTRSALPDLRDDGDDGGDGTVAPLSEADEERF